jgi:hypothetical protein
LALALYLIEIKKKIRVPSGNWWLARHLLKQGQAGFPVPLTRLSMRETAALFAPSLALSRGTKAVRVEGGV